MDLVNPLFRLQFETFRRGQRTEDTWWLRMQNRGDGRFWHGRKHQCPRYLDWNKWNQNRWLASWRSYVCHSICLESQSQILLDNRLLAKHMVKSLYAMSDYSVILIVAIFISNVAATVIAAVIGLTVLSQFFLLILTAFLSLLHLLWSMYRYQRRVKRRLRRIQLEIMAERIAHDNDT